MPKLSIHPELSLVKDSQDLIDALNCFTAVKSSRDELTATEDEIREYIASRELRWSIDNLNNKLDISIFPVLQP
jgi:hypothetical protein|tara:strand:- start:1467 stop:1688 length:222 start_codon:yes stop_codon:yes gene_type:complete